jgi:predicted dehydrogenase
MLIRLGIVGSGFMATTWTTVANQSVPLKPVAVCGGKNANHFSVNHGLSFFGSLEDMLRSDLIDMVVITSPEQFHHQQTCESLRAGKHVLVEKPMANSVAEVQEMIELSKRFDRRLGVVSQNRNRFSLRTAKSLIGSDAIGEIRFLNVTGEVEYWWDVADDSKGWKTQFDKLNLWASWASHACDLINFLSDQEAVSVSAVARPETQGPFCRSVAALFELSGGAISTVQLSHTSVVPKLRPTMRFEIVGESGLLIFDTHGSIRMITAGSDTCLGAELDQGQGNSSYLDPSVVFNPTRLSAYRQQLDDFARSVVVGTEPEVNGAAGLRTQLMVQGVLSSIQSSTVVKL